MKLINHHARGGITRRPRRSRSGALAVECAFVIPVFVLLLLGIIIGGFGVFQYQQTACLAREAARWTSVRGADYQKDTDLPSPAKSDIWAQAVVPFAVDMDTAQLTMKVEWIDKVSNQVIDWDAAPKDVRSLTPLGEYVTNTVRVTITYPWNTGLFGNVTLSSVCEWPMAF
jgi:Flp pilus assembly protein TadG